MTRIDLTNLKAVEIKLCAEVIGIEPRILKPLLNNETLCCETMKRVVAAYRLGIKHAAAKQRKEIE